MCWIISRCSKSCVEKLSCYSTSGKMILMQDVTSKCPVMLSQLTVESWYCCEQSDFAFMSPTIWTARQICELMCHWPWSIQVVMLLFGQIRLDPRLWWANHEHLSIHPSVHPSLSRFNDDWWSPSLNRHISLLSLVLCLSTLVHPGSLNSNCQMRQMWMNQSKYELSVNHLHQKYFSVV